MCELKGSKSVRVEPPCPWNLNNDIGKVFQEIRNLYVMYNKILTVILYSVAFIV